MNAPLSTPLHVCRRAHLWHQRHSSHACTTAAAGWQAGRPENRGGLDKSRLEKRLWVTLVAAPRSLHHPANLWGLGEQTTIECWRYFRKTMRYDPRALPLFLSPSLSPARFFRLRFLAGLSVLGFQKALAFHPCAFEVKPVGVGYMVSLVFMVMVLYVFTSVSYTMTCVFSSGLLNVERCRGEGGGSTS